MDGRRFPKQIIKYQTKGRRRVGKLRKRWQQMKSEQAIVWSLNRDYDDDDDFINKEIC